MITLLTVALLGFLFAAIGIVCVVIAGQADERARNLRVLQAFDAQRRQGHGDH